MNAHQRRKIARKYPLPAVTPPRHGEYRPCKLILKDKAGRVVYEGMGYVTMTEDGKIVPVYL